MKKTLTLLLSVLIGSFCGLIAQNPVLYLRCHINQWNASEEYRFTENNGHYSLHLDSFEGQFKVAGEDWTNVQLIYSTPVGQNVTVTGSGDYLMHCQASGGHGENFDCVTLKDVTFSFDYVPDQDITLKVEASLPPVEGLSGTLPVLYINVYTDESKSALNNEIIDMNLAHKNYFSFAEYWLDLNGCEWMEAEGAASIGSREAPLPLEIKARGNWTRKGFAKKPFKLKLKEKQKMLGLSKSKHFAILAHADDNFGYMRNYVGFNLGKRIGLPWTPSQQPVEVVINGDYRGLYFLTESIRIEKNRIDIQELEDNVSDPTLISGGYLVELDNYDEENQIQMAEQSCVTDQWLDRLRVTWDTPEEYSEIQKRFITDQFEAMNNLVGENSDDLWKYLDLDDAVRYYLVEEIVSHTESYHGSTYLFRDRGEGQKWHFSPLWDFGNAWSGNDDAFFYDCDSYGNTWIPSIRQNAKFNDKVKATWLWFMNNGYKGLVDDIDLYEKHLRAAAVADHKRWDGKPHPEGGQAVADNSSMPAKAAKVKNRLSAKINWLKKQFGNYLETPDAPEPERDDTEAAPLPDYAGVENVSADIDDSNAPAEYFDIMGRRIACPAAGAVVIERRGSTVRKIRM